MRKPARPFFSSGPTVKPVGWNAAQLGQSPLLNRNHRASVVEDALSGLIARTRQLADIPHDYVLMFMPGSCTGAFEAACWAMLGPNPVDCLEFDPFGRAWSRDVIDELGIDDSRRLIAPDGHIPDLNLVNPAHDLVTVWNATPTGVMLPNLPKQGEGLVFADVTSAIFMTPLPWDQIDVAAFSAQKALGGEAQLGFLVLSPRAIERLDDGPYRPIPKLLRISPFDQRWALGRMINTPSLLALADWDMVLRWAEDLGGAKALQQKVAANFDVIQRGVSASQHLYFAVAPKIRSHISVTLTAAGYGSDRGRYAHVAERLEDLGVAHDISGHRLAQPGLRIWCGPTVEADDLEALMPWVEATVAERVI